MVDDDDTRTGRARGKFRSIVIHLCIMHYILMLRIDTDRAWDAGNRRTGSRRRESGCGGRHGGTAVMFGICDRARFIIIKFTFPVTVNTSTGIQVLIP